ncbi:MAG TPA: glycosyltransferase family 4 protein [Gemmatimonadales bacterium]|jgi:glycosyltransferase involved in cell wall biosynthesis|nr:glycosyltransferase family 4 protein [Gemmatimonadales bacterium]
MPDLRGVAVCSLAYTHYASDARVRRMCEALAQAGARVDVVCLRADGAPATVRVGGVSVHGVGLARHRGNLDGYLGSWVSFAAAAMGRLAVLRTHTRYDVVHVNTMPDFLVAAALPFRLLGSRVLLDFHDVMPELFEEKFPGRRTGFVRLLRLVERMAAAGANQVLAVQEPHRLRLLENRIPASKISVVLNSPDPAIFQPVARTEDPDRFRFVYHGTVATRHGLDLAVRALAIARRQRSRICLRIMGAGDGMDEVERIAEAEGLGDAVEIRRGMIPVDRIPGELADANAGVVPMRAGPAMDISLPTKLLEFSIMGIPAIASRTRATTHYFGANAVLFFEPGDVEGLARQMIAMHDDEELRGTLQEAAAKVAQEWSWESQRRTYLSLISRLAHRGGVAKLVESS